MNAEKSPQVEGGTCCEFRQYKSHSHIGCENAVSMGIVFLLRDIIIVTGPSRRIPF